MILAALAAACGDPVKISQSDQILPYSPQLVNYAAQTGAMAAQAYGNPFGSPSDAAALIEGLPLPGWFTTAKLTARPGPNVAANIRVVIVFNPGWKGPGMDDACRNAGALPLGPGGGASLRIAATLCADNRAISWLVAEAPTPKGPDDPAFRRLMDQVLVNLLPHKFPTP